MGLRPLADASTAVSEPPEGIAPPVDERVGHCTSDAASIPDGAQDLPSEAHATLESEPKDGDDPQSHTCAPAPCPRLGCVCTGRGTSPGSKPTADTGHSLVSTGLARGPP